MVTCYEKNLMKEHLSRQSLSWGSTSHSTASVILGQVLSFITCGGRTQTELTACD